MEPANRLRTPVRVTPARVAGAAVAAALLAAGGWLASGRLTPSGPSDRPADPLAPTPGVPWFVDVAGAAGVSFRHFDSATPHHYIQETMGGGVAWIDYDGDGWPDLFCVQDGPVRSGPLAERADHSAPTHKLYCNNRDGTFTDVTEQVGLNKSGYGMGA